jgi:predicted AlkP superfamily phosphohydrolase/phosphomutase
MVMYAAMNGHIYLNVKGRNRQGCVERGPDYDQALEDLRQRFGNLVDPLSSEPLFVRITTPAELYQVKPEDGERLGDLILIPRPGYIVHQSAARKGDPIKLQPSDALAGCHYYEGIYIVRGKNIKRHWTEKAHIVDIAPTVYALLGAETPAYLDGRALENLFEHKVTIKVQRGPDQSGQGTPGQRSLSAEEEAEVARQLAALGYLD